MAVDPDRYVRKLVTIPRELWAQIEDFRFEYRIGTESEALRRLLDAGLQAAKEPPKPRSRRS